MQLPSAPSLLLALLLVVPSVQAEATGIHVLAREDGYLVAFTSNATAPPEVAWDAPSGGGHAAAKLASAPGEDDADYTATLPADATRYTVEGRSFALPARPRADATTRIAFLADVGLTNNSTRVLAAVEAAKPDLVLLGGDLSYANGHRDRWDAWLEALEPLAARIPVLVAMGNHEALCVITAEGDLKPCAQETTEYDEHFPPPDDERFQALTWGPARLVALDSEAYHPTKHMPDPTDPVAQMEFLNATLADADDAWRIVLFHRPPYSSNLHGDDVADENITRDLVPALEEGEADLVLYGHAHAYERTWPLRAGAPTSHDAEIRRGSGIVYVDSGGGGESLYPDWAPQPAWSAVRNATFEFVLLTVSPTRLEVRALDPNGTAVDSFAILASSEGSAPTGSAQPTENHATPSPGLAFAVLAVLVALAMRRGRG